MVINTQSPDTRPPSASIQVGVLIGLLVITFGAAAIGGWVTAQSVDTWYQAIAKPPWAPPDWVFGPVWTVLYGLMALAAWLVWRQSRNWQRPLALYGGQLVLNVFWSVAFFGWQSPQLAAIEIVLLWLAIVATLVSFWRRSVVAGLLLVPYWGWTSFAAVLNFEIWRING